MAYYYEKLEVWKKAVDFAITVMNNLTGQQKGNHHQHIIQEVETSAIHIATAIAKGKGYASKHDFTHHLYQSRGSVYETMTLLEILKRKHIISDNQFADFDSAGQKLTAMLSGLIKSIYNPKTKSGDNLKKDDDVGQAAKN